MYKCKPLNEHEDDWDKFDTHINQLCMEQLRLGRLIGRGKPEAIPNLAMTRLTIYA